MKLLQVDHKSQLILSDPGEILQSISRTLDVNSSLLLLGDGGLLLIDLFPPVHSCCSVDYMEKTIL